MFQKLTRLTTYNDRLTDEIFMVLVVTAKRFIRVSLNGTISFLLV